MDIVVGKTRIIYLNKLPRFWHAKPELDAIAHFRDHLYWHKGDPVDADNISFTLEREPGRNAVIVDGVVEEIPPPPLVSCAPFGRRARTIATTRRNELLFRYRRGILPASIFPFSRRHIVITPLFRRLVERMGELLDHIDEPGVADQLDLMALAIVAAALAPLPPRGESATASERIRSVADRISQHPEEDFNIKTAALDIGMSRAAFYREWNKAYSVSPYRMLLESRLRIAKWYLRETSLPVREVAFQSGFRSPEVFSEVFSRNCGVSPLEYRNGKV